MPPFCRRFPRGIFGAISFWYCTRLGSATPGRIQLDGSSWSRWLVSRIVSWADKLWGRRERDEVPVFRMIVNVLPLVLFFMHTFRTAKLIPHCIMSPETWVQLWYRWKIVSALFPSSSSSKTRVCTQDWLLICGRLVGLLRTRYTAVLSFSTFWFYGLSFCRMLMFECSTKAKRIFVQHSF